MSLSQIVAARSALAQQQIALQQILNSGAGFDATKIETLAANPLVRVALGKGQAVNDIVTALLAAMNTADFKDKAATLYQGGRSSRT